MAYLVRTMPRAEHDLEAIFLYIRGENSPLARDWFNRLVQSIESLSEHPQRHPSIPEDRSLRHLLYGNKPHIYRIVYSIDLHARQVNVIHIRHHARKPFQL